MAIFNKSNKESIQNISAKGTTTIASGTTIRGDIDTEANLNIDGFLNGNIKSTCGVSIGNSGKVEGTIIAERVIVSGNVSGDIECETLEIISGGKAEGNVLATKLIIQEGAIFEGASKRKVSGIIEEKKKDNK